MEKSLAYIIPPPHFLSPRAMKGPSWLPCLVNCSQGEPKEGYCCGQEQVSLTPMDHSVLFPVQTSVLHPNLAQTNNSKALEMEELQD